METLPFTANSDVSFVNSPRRANPTGETIPLLFKPRDIAFKMIIEESNCRLLNEDEESDEIVSL